MRHHNANRKFGRKKDQRLALLRSLAEALIKKGKIRTTEAKAKELRPFVEKLVTLARRNTLASRRLVISRLGAKERASELLQTIAPRYLGRPGGYTRITKLSPRLSDSAKMAIIEFV
jgi:large subunit ribosomal protein L17